jgi:hypothetical protein
MSIYVKAGNMLLSHRDEDYCDDEKGKHTIKVWGNIYSMTECLCGKHVFRDFSAKVKRGIHGKI